MAQKRIHKNVWFYHSHSYYCYVNECYKAIERVLFVQIQNGTEFAHGGKIDRSIARYRFEWENEYNAVDLRLKNANEMTQSERLELQVKSGFRWLSSTSSSSSSSLSLLYGPRSLIENQKGFHVVGLLHAFHCTSTHFFHSDCIKARTRFLALTPCNHCLDHLMSPDCFGSSSFSNECNPIWLAGWLAGERSFMGFKFFTFDFGKPVCSFASVECRFVEWMFLVQTTISGQSYCLFGWRHLQHIWMNIECIHVSKFFVDPSTNFKILEERESKRVSERCIVGSASYFVVLQMKEIQKKISVVKLCVHRRDRFLLFLFFHSIWIFFPFSNFIKCSGHTEMSRIFIDKFHRSMLKFTSRKKMHTPKSPC